MPRPICQRQIRHEPEATYFKPRGVPLVQLVEVVLTLDEVEALRLADYEQLYHETAAKRMGVSRATFGRIVESARGKVAEALVNGRALRLKGGVVTMNAERIFTCNDCGHRWELAPGMGRPTGCPVCQSENFERTSEEHRHRRRGWQHQHAGHGDRRRLRRHRKTGTKRGSTNSQTTESTP